MTDYKEASKKVHQQTQEFPGKEKEMSPKPVVIRDGYKGTGKLKGKVALITGGDSGIGRSVAVHFAREGADIAFIYLTEDEDAENTRKMVENEGGKCLVIKGDIRDRDFCKSSVNKVVKELKGLNILINHAGEQHPADDMDELDLDIMRDTFETNIFAMYYLTKPALKHMKEGDTIINTTSVTAYYGSPHFFDYSATNGAIISFTRSLARNVAKKGIRVNAVAPGPIWTPLIVSTFDENEEFGNKSLLGRPGQPCEVATSYVFLASEDGSYTTGQVMHPNGGMYMAS